ncbi:YbjN domain-containing protein [filamentous cyanobacterium LEGE 11480]|uniref:YbjN domain-containing protein n=1 Tax=Romeriopsis navalis LEGE 11480 TaxID=2777977 RepID=A0A928VQG8_9CYAN|nr:YbjN domain-containing protein [Romeriopsis navalis]MBE9032796.1 YbjN domain-containing protein [Romeriopsis navalis LEGE 11480]
MTVAAEELTVEPVLAEDLMSSINIVDEIESVISTLDYDKTAMVSHGEHGNLWKFNYGSVEVLVKITGETDDDTFTVWSTLFSFGEASLDEPSTNHAKLMHKVLGMNWIGTLDAKFAISGNELVVTVSRPIADLSPSEISRGITLVATIADDNDEAFQEQHGS